MLRKALLAAFAAAICLSPATTRAAMSVSVAVGGRTFMSFLPFTVALQLGYFKQEGLDVQVNELLGGSKSTEALVGGSVDFALGSLEHAIYLRAKGIDVKGIVLFTKSYGAVLSLKPVLAKTYKSPSDLKGLTIGITAPGSSMALALDILLAKGNLPTSATSMVAIGGGAGAVAAAKSGRLDGVVLTDPQISVLAHDNDMIPVVDTRTAAGMKYLYGGFIAAATVLATSKTIAEKGPQSKAFVKAIVHALQWLKKATPEQVTSIVPPSYYGNNRDLYKELVARAQEMYSSDGVIELPFAENSYRVLTEYHQMSGTIDIKETFDNSFVEEK